MRTISILGTGSSAGKSWVATALCAWLRKQGLKVAPFKAQNMANNAFATRSGGEIGVAQAIQAFACGMEPEVDMNPVLLKPVGSKGSQIVRLGRAGEVLQARDYYEAIAASRRLVHETLDTWRDRCDVLVMEGAGSPVELNLMERDIVNLEPVRHTDGRWILVGNIEKGGVFAQIIGTWHLLPEADRRRGLGFIVNQFRGDVGLFSEASEHFKAHMELPYLGVLPHDEAAHLEDEDSMSARVGHPSGDRPYIAWIRYPRVANSQDQLPCKRDAGVEHIWVDRPELLEQASGIVLPGSKSTTSDLRWLKERGLADALQELAAKSKPILGICGGYQMLGELLIDREGEVEEVEPGLGLLPMNTTFLKDKRVIRHCSRFKGTEWGTFEIHTGESRATRTDGWQSLLEIEEGETWGPEGMACGSVWGSYQHGLLDAPVMRKRFLEYCGIGQRVGVDELDWDSRRRAAFDRMVELLEEHLDLEPIRWYLGI